MGGRTDDMKDPAAEGAGFTKDDKLESSGGIEVEGDRVWDKMAETGAGVGNLAETEDATSPAPEDPADRA